MEHAEPRKQNDKIPIVSPGAGECGRKPSLGMSSNCFLGVLIHGHGRELLVPHVSSAEVFLRLRLAALMHVESGCPPDRHVRLPEKRRKRKDKGYSGLG